MHQQSGTKATSSTAVLVEQDQGSHPQTNCKSLDHPISK
ncbi:hypothetical protein EV13_0553 [Prochlorococcus sp. MIT 0702]|nr:hypothetical protein EV12_1755 [Prochlorococcus sp. MIT 0701]KGG30221.1 hypothetical protein EV13_0553 [Prochlorococcus sp. MIT 0702]KGG34960.1 hypothetical protein EV14_1004 [Prochlorococcus sp. MIT 0703]